MPKLPTFFFLILCANLPGHAADIDLTIRGPLKLGTYISEGGDLDRIWNLLDAAPDSRALQVYLWGRILASGGSSKTKFERGIIPKLLMERDEPYLTRQAVADLLSSMSGKRPRYSELGTLQDDLTRLFLRKFTKNNDEISAMCFASLTGEPDAPSLSADVCALVIRRLCADPAVRKRWGDALVNPESRFTEAVIPALRTLLYSESQSSTPTKAEISKALNGSNWPLHLAILAENGVSDEKVKDNGMSLERQRQIIFSNMTLVTTYAGLAIVFQKFGSAVMGVEEKQRTEMIDHLMTKYRWMRGGGLFRSDEQFAANQKIELTLMLLKSIGSSKDSVFGSHRRSILENAKADMGSPDDMVRPEAMLKLLDEINREAK